MDFIKRMISDLEAEEIAEEEKLKEAVSNRQWAISLSHAQTLCELRSSLWALEDVLEHLEKSNQPK